MNGVRRLWSGGNVNVTPTTPTTNQFDSSVPSTPTLPITAPLTISGKPSWPPSSPPDSPTAARASPKTSTAALFFRNNNNYNNGSNANSSLNYANGNGANHAHTLSGSSNGSGVGGSGSGRLLKKPVPMTIPADEGDAAYNFRPSSKSSASPARSNSNGSAKFSSLSSPIAGPSSPRAPPMPSRVSQLSSSRKSGTGTGTESKRSSAMLDVRDDLLMSLLASEAIVDSRGYDVLSAEEVEELKKEHQVLAARRVAAEKKLALETKIRDAALSLSKASASQPPKAAAAGRTSADTLEAANRKVEQAQRELYRIAERANDVSRRLLEHRASVLSYSLRALEKQHAPPEAGDGSASMSMSSTSGYSTPNRSSQVSNGTSATSVGSSSLMTPLKARFDGAHFFAGHEGAIVPRTPRLAPSVEMMAEVEEKLRAATEAVEEARRKEGEMSREVALLRLEKEEVETRMGMELQSVGERMTEVEREAGRVEELEAQARVWEEEREAWALERVELERRLEEVEARSGETTGMEAVLAQEREERRAEVERKEQEMADLNVMWETDRAAWEVERATLMNELEERKAKVQESAGQSQAQLDEHFDALGELVQAHGILLVSREGTFPVLVASVGKHLEGVNAKLEASVRAQEDWNATRAKLEADVRAGLDKREALSGDLEQARRERDEAKMEVRELEAQLTAQSAASFMAMQAASQAPVEYTGDAAKIVATLQPLWAILPSPEARANKTGTRTFKTATSSPLASPVTARSGPSLSEMDVRSLKTLYDPKGLASPVPSAAFTVEGFVDRVHALVADDRALIERLIRFAQAHDLLKKNAERAQKLAQESNLALETYQKQVKTLEDRNMTLVSRQAALQDELHQLQDAVERIQAEKLEVESLAAEQAETCRQLTDANNTLSARALSLADEAASATDSVRKQLEAQLSECKASLAKANEQIESMSRSQQSQQMMLMDELNSVQTENSNLRAQLRAKK